MNYVIKKLDTVDTNEHDISVFHDYQFPFTQASLGVSEIFNTYPEEGYDMDESVDAYWYVEKGSTHITLDDTIYDLEAGDMIFIPKGMKYKIDTTYVKLVVCSTPSWYPAQHKHLEK